MGKLDIINRVSYIYDMNILNERITNLEEKMDLIMDKISRIEVETLKDIKRKPAETNKTKKKAK
jgi:hypothetical protein